MVGGSKGGRLVHEDERSEPVNFHSDKSTRGR